MSGSRRESSFSWPCPAADHPGTPILHREQFSRGLGLFHPIEYLPAAEETDARFPMVLTTGRMLEHFHTGTMTRRSKGLERSGARALRRGERRTTPGSSASRTAIA